MFPLKTLRKPQRTPYVTYGLIALNVLVFIWQLSLSQMELSNAYQTLALIPCEISRNFFSVNTLLDSVRTMFLHGSWMHIISNMLFLVVFGPNVEDFLGRAGYLVFYLVTGLAAGLLHTAINWNVCVPTIGASGAVFGLMGAFLLLYPATRVRTVAFFFRIPVGVVNVQAFYMLLYLFVIDLINGLGSLGVATYTTRGVAFWAHVGGFLMGLLIAFAVTIFKPAPKVDPLEYLNAD